MTTARDIVWALVCSFLIAGFIFGTLCLWFALFSAFYGRG